MGFFALLILENIIRCIDLGNLCFFIFKYFICSCVNPFISVLFQKEFGLNNAVANIVFLFERAETR